MVNRPVKVYKVSSLVVQPPGSSRVDVSEPDRSHPQKHHIRMPLSTEENPPSLLFIFKAVRGVLLFFAEKFNLVKLMETSTYLEVDHVDGGDYEM